MKPKDKKRPDDTLPPHQPNTPRVWLSHALTWAKAHPDWLLIFAFGVLAGWIVL